MNEYRQDCSKFEKKNGKVAPAAAAGYVIDHDKQ